MKQTQIAALILLASAGAACSQNSDAGTFRQRLSTDPVRVRAGDIDYTDGSGNVWSADTTYASGGDIYTTSNPISGTGDEAIYQTERYGTFGYAIPVANGCYDVTLRFAEIYWTDGPEQRVFNVSLEGKKVLANADILNETTPNAALDKKFNVAVSDEVLSVDFETLIDNAKISGVEALQTQCVTASGVAGGVSAQPKAPSTTPHSPNPAPNPASPLQGGSSVSGEAMPQGDLPGWKQVFTDDFTKDVSLGSFPSAVSDKWDAYPDGWPDTSHNGTYFPSKVVSIGGGTMNVHIHTENGVSMVAAPLPRVPGASGSGGLLYGRFAIRFKADPLPGYKTAWLLWPDSGTWPRDGEIDFPEGDLDGTIGGFIHLQGATSGSDQDAYSSSATYTSWHTAVLEWAPGATQFILDGKSLGVSTSRIPDTPMHWVIQTETSLSGRAPEANTAGNVTIDWVSVYTRN